MHLSPESNNLSEFPDLMSIVLPGYDRIIHYSFSQCNFHFNDAADSKALEFLDVLVGRGFVQHVKRATHNHKSALDLVITTGIKIDMSDITDVPISDYFWGARGLMPLCLNQSSV